MSAEYGVTDAIRFSSACCLLGDAPRHRLFVPVDFA